MGNGWLEGVSKVVPSETKVSALPSGPRSTAGCRFSEKPMKSLRDLSRLRSSVAFSA